MQRETLGAIATTEVDATKDVRCYLERRLCRMDTELMIPSAVALSLKLPLLIFPHLTHFSNETFLTVKRLTAESRKK